MYFVVEFADENVLAVIPDNWLDTAGNSCVLWPPYKDDKRVMNAARNREVPGDQWKSFPLRKTMYKTGKFVSLFSGIIAKAHCFII